MTLAPKPAWQLGHFETAPVCEWCLVALFTPIAGEPGRHDDRTRDHVIPRSRGGLDRQDNVVAACRLCNNLRGHMAAVDFRLVAREHIAPYRYDLEELRRHLTSIGFGRWAAIVERARHRALPDLPTSAPPEVAP